MVQISAGQVASGNQQSRLKLEHIESATSQRFRASTQTGHPGQGASVRISERATPRATVLLPHERSPSLGVPGHLRRPCRNPSIFRLCSQVLLDHVHHGVTLTFNPLGAHGSLRDRARAMMKA